MSNLAVGGWGAQGFSLQTPNLQGRGGPRLRFETTTQRPVEVTGVGLHSGVNVGIRILPAAAGTDITFVRTDLDGFHIPASWKYVARVSYATSLMRQGVLL